ncbi:prolyl 4-hydroxylase [Paenibacillus sp. J22TS3]|nr:prolyl 4-hydroxylase [Paenibacillus sp. J22TS3]
MKIEHGMPNKIADQVARLDWNKLQGSLDEQGYAKLPALLDEEGCDVIIRTYEQDELFRSTIDMGRFRYGDGEYRYYCDPLPSWLQELRRSLYPELSKTANRWHEQLGKEFRYPSNLDEFILRCHQHGQTRPTPLILKYEAGGYNCLHQDLYGEVFFPFQVVFALNQYGLDYEGGEFLLVEARPRAQSRGRVVTLNRGEGLIFPTQYRPVSGTKGYYRTTLRHGVSEITAGMRYSLGVIFHDAL